MEWIETTAKSVEEAQELALDKLGVDTADAEFEVLEEPRQGLFGRTRGQARIRARVAPQSPRGKEDRGRRKRKPRGKSEGQGNRKPRESNNSRQTQSQDNSETSDVSESASDSNGGSDDTNQAPRRNNGSRNRSKNGRGGDSGSRRERPPRNRSDSPKKEDASMEEVSACVETFLSGLTTAFGIDADLDVDTSNDEIMAKIAGKHGLLLGPKARTLDAIQELTRVTAQRTVPSSIRIKVDVGGYREARKDLLQDFARKAGAKALEDSVEVVLEPMSSADRKVVHDELNDYDGVSTRSAGTDPRRRVVVVPDAPVEDDVVASDDESGDAAGDDE